MLGIDEERMELWQRRMARHWLFLQRAAAKAADDELALRSVALAFITMLSLVPLLAAFSYLGALVFRDEPAPLVELMQLFLPYSETTIVAQLNAYIEQARAIQGFGFFGFLATSMVAFVTVDQTLNRIWSVTRNRPLRIRLRSFTLVLFWGPLVIGATYSSLFFLRQRMAFQPFAEAVISTLVPFAVTLLGLTMLYWLVPFTIVRPRNAFWGALVASILLELLRQGFGLYIAFYQRFSSVYGGFGLALIFLISIQLAWWIVLFGSEVAYCVQHYGLMLRPRRPGAILDGSWLGLLAIVAITDRFRAGEPFTAHEDLAERLQVTGEALERILTPLFAAGLIKPSRDEAGYLLSCDPYRVTVRDVLATYEAPHDEVLAALSPTLADTLRELRGRVVDARGRELATLTLAELLGVAPRPATASP